MFQRTCKVCLAKDAHLASLQAEIDSLRRMLAPPMQVLPSVDLTFADHMLGASHEQTLNEEPKDINESMLREAERILSGSYDNFG